jgi:hypothetical protein
VLSFGGVTTAAVDLFRDTPAEPAVEVQDAFTGAWHRGFTVVDRTTAGVVVRRASDGAVLPHAFGPDRIRPA